MSALETWTILWNTLYQGSSSFEDIRWIEIGRKINRSTLKSRLVFSIETTKRLSGHDHMTAKILEKDTKSAFEQFEKSLRKTPALNSPFAMPHLRFYNDNSVVWTMCGVHVGGTVDGTGFSFTEKTMPAFLTTLTSLPFREPGNNTWMLNKPAGARPVGATASEALMLHYILTSAGKFDPEILPNPLPQIALCAKRQEVTQEFKTLMETCL